MRKHLLRENCQLRLNRFLILLQIRRIDNFLQKASLWKNCRRFLPQYLKDRSPGSFKKSELVGTSRVDTYPKNLNKQWSTSNGDKNKKRQDKGEKTTGSRKKPTSGETFDIVLFLDWFFEERPHYLNDFKLLFKLFASFKSYLKSLLIKTDNFITMNINLNL